MATVSTAKMLAQSRIHTILILLRRAEIAAGDALCSFLPISPGE